LLGDKLREQQQREAAYRKFILELYHATPVSGHVWLHGVKAGRMVHIAAVDAPVTRADVILGNDTTKTLLVEVK